MNPEGWPLIYNLTCTREWGDAYLRGLQKNHWNSYEMLEFRLCRGTLGFCSIKCPVICLQILLIYILTNISIRPVVGVFGSVISSSSLGFICWPRKLSENWRVEVFRGIFGRGHQGPFEFIPLRLENYFLQGKQEQWWITVVHAKMHRWSWQHPSIEPSCHVWSKPSLSATASPYRKKRRKKKNMHASIRKVSICGWLFMFTSLLLALHKVLMSL